MLAPLIKRIQQRFGTTLVGIVYYGSCLRAGTPYDGLVDFYVVIDSYRQAYREAHASILAAAANRLVPPNVYYLEADAPRPDAPDALLRCKYAVLSQASLQNGVAHDFLSGLWGRFAQPVAIVHARDSQARQRLQACCGQAVLTLLARTLPMLASPATPAQAYERALALSYGSELRTEKTNRSQAVVSHDAQEYTRRLHAAAPYLPFRVEPTDAGHDAGDEPADGRIYWLPKPAQRRRAARAWRLRQPAGHALSVLRLSKACFTFGNAVDYGAWKIERHTGVHVDVTPRLRKHPLIYGWPVLWRLYRAGALR